MQPSSTHELPTEEARAAIRQCAAIAEANRATATHRAILKLLKGIPIAPAAIEVAQDTPLKRLGAAVVANPSVGQIVESNTGTYRHVVGIILAQRNARPIRVNYEVPQRGRPSKSGTCRIEVWKEWCRKNCVTLVHLAGSKGSRVQRIETANTIIRIIAGRGRYFFRYKKAVSFFSLRSDDSLIFTESYGNKVIDAASALRTGWNQQIHHGSTLCDLIDSLAVHIEMDLPIKNHFGPWPSACSNGDLWGYGPEEMIKVRRKLRRLVPAIPLEKRAKAQPPR